MTETKIEVGDIVRLHPAEASVVWDNDDGRLDLQYLDGGERVEYIPTDKVTFVRKRPVAEPALGTFIRYVSSFAVSGGTDWVRSEKGWFLLDKGVASTYGACKWTDFDPARVRLYQAATTPPK